jgi:hypothetical protein
MQLASRSVSPSRSSHALQQNRPTIGTGVRLVELHNHRTAKQIGKQDTLCCGIVSHAKASRVVEKSCGKAFLPRQGLLFFEKSRIFRVRVSGTLAGAQTMMDKMLDQIRQGPQASQLPVSFWDDARKRLSNESDLLRLWTPAYADQLSDTEIRGLIGFYTSPVGTRFVAALPAIQSESLDAGAQLGADAAKRAVHEVMGPLPQWRLLHPPAPGATPTERPPEKDSANSNPP